MTRRECLLLPLAALAGCRNQAPAADLLPATVAGKWKLTRTVDIPPEGAPKLVRDLGYRRGVRGQYEGPTSFAVTVYEMTSQAGAFELLQKWRASEGRTHFQKNQLFVFVEMLGEQNNNLKEFTDALEKEIK